MKVCQILASVEDGGLEKHVIELTNILVKKGIDTTIIAHPKYKRFIESADFIEVDFSKSRNNPFLLYKLIKSIKVNEFDIVHSHANKATSILAKIKPFINSKTVATLHSLKKKLTDFEKMDYVITVSDRIGESLNIKNKTTIYNGIKLQDTQYIDLRKKYNIKSRYVICAIGRFVEVKRFDLLINAMSYLDDIHLILVGDGDKDIVESAKAKKNITLTGYLDNESAKKILNSSDACVISSQREGFPYVFVESMLLQTPVISTDVSDIKKFIPKQCLITELDGKKIAKTIKNFFEKYEENIKSYENFFQRAQKEFSIDTMVGKTINVYKEAVK